ncbi:MAG: S8 family serine peptidase, partial [Bryobacteraceae bacterium]|nr:S8 family serine peptidase [Bryobacteraceae bacterium]
GVGTVGSYPKGFTGVGGTVYFAADGGEGEELWKTDGTAAGTVLVKDIRKGAFPLGGGPAGSFPRELTELNGRLYFTADNGDSAKNANGRELWTSDGTAKGTVMVKDIFPGKSSSKPEQLTKINGRLYFTANDGVHGVELWQSNGTAAGTVLVRDIKPGSAGSDPTSLVAMNNTLYFSADDGVHGRELWDPPPVPPSSITPNDPLLARQWGLQVTQADLAWNLTTGSTTVVVAVNDNGVDYTHPDLYKNIWINQEEIPAGVRALLQDVDGDGLITFWDLNEPVNQGPGKITDLNGTGFIDGGDLLRPIVVGGWADGLDNGGNGYIDDLIGWDFVNDNNDPMGTDRHGTHVAGTIGAMGDNGLGVTGVNGKVQIMPLERGNAENTATIQDSVDALYYAVNNGARVSNHSYGAPAAAFTEAELAAIDAVAQYALANEHLIVAAALNNSSNIDTFPVLPAGSDLPNIISVAATTKNDKLWKASNFGTISVDLGAPGVNIWSTVPGGDYAKFDGTSMAAPHVTGAAALILSINPNLTFAQVKALILDNVDVVPDLVGKTVTGGRLNIFKAVAATPLPLLASSMGNGTTETLTLDQVTPLLAEAVTRWQAAGVDASVLHSVDLRIADLGGTTLGQAAGNTIWLDINAAGWGWFVDATPWNDSEFTTPGDQEEQHRMDLLSALMHEIGHLLGEDHREIGGMQETLTSGTRLAISADGNEGASRFDTDALFALLAADKDATWIGGVPVGRGHSRR